MNILAVTCMRNEAPYCLEWIAHHRTSGITEFLIYTHDCTDGTDAILNLIPGVTHVSFAPTEGKSPQWHAMRMADQHPAMKAADWAIFFDCDEFICLTEPLNTLPDLITSVPDETDAIALQWRLFGASGHTEWEDGLVIERFIMAAPSDLTLPAGHFFKSLFRPDRFQKLGVHRPKNKKGSRPNWNLAGAQTAPETFSSNDKRINLYGVSNTSPNAWLNHYSVKSVTEFMIKKDRGLPNRRSKNIDLGYWAERNFNISQNHTIQGGLNDTKAELDTISKIDGLRQLLQTAHQSHLSRFNALMKSHENVMMFLHLSLLKSSAPPKAQDINTHLSRLAQTDDSL